MHFQGPALLSTSRGYGETDTLIHKGEVRLCLFLSPQDLPGNYFARAHSARRSRRETLGSAEPENVARGPSVTANQGPVECLVDGGPGGHRHEYPGGIVLWEAVDSVE